MSNLEEQIAKEFCPSRNSPCGQCLLHARNILAIPEFTRMRQELEECINSNTVYEKRQTELQADLARTQRALELACEEIVTVQIYHPYSCPKTCEGGLETIEICTQCINQHFLTQADKKETL